MSDAVQWVYCMDTSCFRELHRNYPRGIFPGLYTALAGLIHQGRLLTIEDVLDEYIEEDIREWMETHRTALVRSKDQLVVDCLQEIMEKCPQFVDHNKTEQEADQPLVALALALTRGAGCSAAVVTQERERALPDKEMRIPDACKRYGIGCMNLLRLMTEEAWQFNRV